MLNPTYMSWHFYLFYFCAASAINQFPMCIGIRCLIDTHTYSETFSIYHPQCACGAWDWSDVQCNKYLLDAASGREDAEYIHNVFACMHACTVEYTYVFLCTYICVFYSRQVCGGNADCDLGPAMHNATVVDATDALEGINFISLCALITHAWNRFDCSISLAISTYMKNIDLHISAMIHFMR
jgi:hypothetical protein